ncbi:MAG: hypothetical protein WDN48_00690 [Pseudolabrys sp.]
MPGLLPILLTGSYLLLAVDKVPELNVEPTCRAAMTAGVRPTRSQDDTACKRDEQAAHDKLTQDWGQFGDGDRSHCVRMSTLGGSPSYVELLTCLELSKQANSLPPDQLETPARTKP